MSDDTKKATNKPPFTWTSTEEGMNAMKRFCGDANKAADYIMKHHFKKYRHGAGNYRNVIHKWLDRIIRKMLGM